MYGLEISTGRLSAVTDKVLPVVKDLLITQHFALNVGNSFYSQSGQALTATAKLLEQFVTGIKMTEAPGII